MRIVYLDERSESSSSEEDLTSSKEEEDGDSLHVIVHCKATKEQVVTLKRGADGEPKQKNPRVNDENQMPIERLLNPVPLEPKKKREPKILMGTEKGRRRSSSLVESLSRWKIKRSRSGFGID